MQLNLIVLAWDFQSFLTKLKGSMTTWVNTGMMILGLVLLFVAAWQIASGLMSHGKKEVPWVPCIIMITLGAALLGGGGIMQALGSGILSTVDQLGGSGGAGFTPSVLPTP